MLSCWAILVLVIKSMFTGNMRKMDNFTKLLLSVKITQRMYLLAKCEIFMA